jgi:hypothetical protein
MQGLKLDIRHPDGRIEEVRIDGDRALIGSGAHCEIRLPVDQAAIEHVLVQANPAGVFAEARSFQPAPTINGGQFTRSQLVPGSVLGIGYTQIVVSVIELMGQASAAARKENKISPMTLIMAAVIMPVGMYIIFFSDPPDTGAGAPPREIPELWAEPVAACPQQGADQAKNTAEDRFALGIAKQERRPFHVQDGVAAVPLFETAAVCFVAAGEQEAAKAASEHNAKLRRDVADDFRTHRVRLEYAISRKNWQIAQKEVRVLLDFLDGQQHEYVNWLSSLDRRLRLKYGDQKRKKK